MSYFFILHISDPDLRIISVCTEVAAFQKLPHRSEAAFGVERKEGFKSVRGARHDGVESVPERAEKKQHFPVGKREIAGRDEDVLCFSVIERGIEPPKGAAGVDVRQDGKTVTGKALRTVAHQHEPVKAFPEYRQRPFEEGFAGDLQERLVPSHAAALPADQDDAGDVVAALIHGLLIT
jgi:hypothetical protein